MRKLQAPKIKGVEKLKKNKPPNITKNDDSQTPKKFLLCSGAVRVQR
jgi:hypothetical protein